MSSLVALAKTSVLRLARLFRVRQPERTLIADAQRFWRDTGERRHAYNSHWKGNGGLPDDVFARLGEQHREIHRRLSRMVGLDERSACIVEWGCGGGVNAVAFAPICQRFVGIDIAPASLDECARVMRDAGHGHFQPVLIDLDEPERAADGLQNGCDLFLCTFVFELIPTQAYGDRILRIARTLLRPGGMAIVQIRYATADWRTWSRPWGYRCNLANMTTYSIDDFWQRCERAGLQPFAAMLQPSQPLLKEERYAYFGMLRP